MNEFHQALSAQQIAEFHDQGYLVMRSFFDRGRDIEPIQRDIYRVIGLVIDKHQLPISRPPFSPETFDDGYQEMISHDRKLGAVVYDAVKHLPSFVRLCSHPSLSALFSELRSTNFPGVSAGGCGIRIDNPFENRFRANWHQDFHGNLRSLNGLVFWSTLIKLTDAMGPVKISHGSHKAGPLRCHTSDPDNPIKSGAYALRWERESDLVASYPIVAPLTEPSDLIVLDYLVLHASGENLADRSRWSMQIRYFDYNDETGRRIDWRGGFNDGIDPHRLFPELFIDS